MAVIWRKFLSEDDWTRLASDARWEVYAEGDVILDQGCNTREIFVLTRGKAQLEEEAGGGLVRLVGELNPDDLYGEECFLEGLPAPAAAVAITDEVECLVLPRATLKSIFDGDRALSERFHRYVRAVMNQRLGDTWNRREQSSLSPSGSIEYSVSPSGPQSEQQYRESSKLEEAEAPMQQWEKGQLYNTRLNQCLTEMKEKLRQAMAALTPYQLKEVLHVIKREKPSVAMPLLQCVAIAIHREQPTSWPDVERMLQAPNLRHDMKHADPTDVAGPELAMLTRLMKRMKTKDLQGIRCINLSIKWLDGFEAAARYYFEHSRLNQSESAIRRGTEGFSRLSVA